jgi:hypothetical protein
VTAEHIAPAPGAPAAQARAAAEVRALIAAAPEAQRWLPAYDQEWEAALAAARVTYSLEPALQVVADWRMRLATAPAVRMFVASGYDDSDAVSLESVIGSRR